MTNSFPSDASAPQEQASDSSTQAVVEQANRLGLQWQLRPATITQLLPLQATYDGDDTALTVTNMVNKVGLGQRVYVIQVPPGGNFIVGTVTDVTLLTVNNHFVAGGPTQTIAAATQTALLQPGSTAFNVTIAKKYAATSLRIDAMGTFYSTGVASSPLFSVFVTGVTGSNANVYTSVHNIGVLQLANASLNSHTPWSGSLTLNNLGIGNAVVSLRWLRLAGTGTLTMDGNDMAALTVSEVFTS